MASDRRERTGPEAAAGSTEELRRRYKAVRKLAPGEPGGDKERYLADLEALHADAEAYGEPGILFKISIEYAYSLSISGWKKHSRELTSRWLAVLRKCLLMWHEAPHRHGEGDVSAMWTQFYRLLDWYIRFHPEPADRVARLIDELERYCPPTRTGARYALDTARMKIAARRGDAAEVDRIWRGLRMRDVPTEHFFRDGVAGTDATMWTLLGRHERAIEAMAPLLAGRMPVRKGARVYEEDLLMPYLHTGRVAEAVAVHQRTYTLPDMKLEHVAAHLEFCARTGNEERGLDVLHRNLHRFGYRCQYVVEVWTAAAAALLCLRAAAKGIDREWVWPCGCDDPGCDDPALCNWAELGAQLRWRAIRFGRRLDRLNGTSFAGERIDALIHAEPLIERLELPPDAGPAAPPAVPPPSAHLDAGDADGLRAELDRARAMELRRPRIVLTQRVVQNALAAGAPDVLADARLRSLDDLLELGWRGWSRNRFSMLRELFRMLDERAVPAEPGRLDALWRAVPVVLDEALTRPGPHLRQVHGLLDAAERHCRPGTEDAHHVRWFRTETTARSGDADATRAAWARFRDLPDVKRYASRANVLRAVGWWLDLGCDQDAIEAMAALPGDDREDLLLPAYLRAGRTAEARALHERTRAAASGPPEVTAHLHYCAETGLLEHGREILHRVIDLFHGSDEDDDFTFADMRLYAAGARICELLANAGYTGNWTWPADECCPDEHDWTYARLAKALRKSVRDESRRWEEVLGTTFHTRAVDGGTGGGIRPSQ
ncbi:hypothetical protein [Actinomadura sp. WMMB 499]|uniref:hypothetical protein n=1 Tax=Actinomadura sp. WMMB 499 TaxID=1219491 RepID=UPI00124564F0|nr:hypothetical protein [Actinomadura sp. WMMB 499]QFG20434.1 hypothetical protein F7P10_03905 [Actinomadura sp. WMMB 499]